MQDKSGCVPEIAYPCRWQFRLLGEDRSAMVAVIAELIDDPTHSLSDGNVSATGRYLSLSLEMTVSSDAERLRIYSLLANSSAIRMVL